MYTTEVAYMGRFKWSKQEAMAALGLPDRDSDVLVEPMEEVKEEEQNERFGREELPAPIKIKPIESADMADIGKDMQNDLFVQNQEDGVNVPVGK